jgi:hypothetical protein
VGKQLENAAWPHPDLRGYGATIKMSGVSRLMQARMHGRVIDDAFWLGRHEV